MYFYMEISRLSSFSFENLYVSSSYTCKDLHINFCDVNLKEKELSKQIVTSMNQFLLKKGKMKQIKEMDDQMDYLDDQS